MAYSFKTSSSRTTSNSTTQQTSDGSTTTQESLSVTTTLATSTPDGSDGLAGVVSGDATAVGQDTFAFGSIEAVADGTGAVSSLDASVTMVAAAEAPADGDLYVSADTFAATSDDAEVTFTTTMNKSSTTQTTESSTASASSTTSVSAFNIESDVGRTSTYGSFSAADTGWDFGGETGGDLDGNVAIMEFGADAFGDDTYVAIDGFALAIEDELSLSAGYLEIAVA
jgi:hypothetical protein